MSLRVELNLITCLRYGDRTASPEEWELAGSGLPGLPSVTKIDLVTSSSDLGQNPTGGSTGRTEDV